MRHVHAELVLPEWPTDLSGSPCASSQAGPVPKGAKNVLMIVVDDWRTEVNSLFGKHYLSTPNIDALMKQSLGFTKAYVQQAICGATRASFLVRD